MKKFILILIFLFVAIDAKVALIFGVTGQDGAYLARLLLKKGYIVHGVKRRSSSFNTERLDFIYRDFHLQTNFFLHYGDLSDSVNIVKLIRKIEPDEIYNLGAQSHVRVSFDIPEYTSDVDGLGALRILEAIVLLGQEKNIKFYQAGSSEMFGLVQEIPQKETTPFYPRSPYGVAKLFGYWITRNYREAYNIFACNGILFNHESPIRGETFVTRKISRAVAQRASGEKNILYLGNLDAKRDWGYAKDYVKAMWMMLQQNTPDDYVISTGEMHSVREFVELAYNEIGIDIEWRGQGLDEEGFDKKTNEILVKIDNYYFRPTEVDLLLGDCSKAKTKLGWQPKTTFKKLVNKMLTHDIKLLQKSK